ncbi:MAG: hypothetical protein U1C97_03300, partial [Candidatus Gracilibacteria bacterium]|nr:hypothetical protein [Candidatus Gracilibacteria bacterium]
MVESVLVPTLEDAREGELSITVAPTLGTYLTNGLQYLATYPYGCAEQVMSSFLPNVVLKSLQGFEAFKIVDDVTLEKNVSEGLQMLYSYQHGDGGFGYWQSSPRSYAYLSAYILFGLQKSQQAGYSVDQGVIDRTRDYLDGVLRTQNLEEYLDLATRAFILYVLA